jgi:hypothetical protein
MKATSAPFAIQSASCSRSCGRRWWINSFVAFGQGAIIAREAARSKGVSNRAQNGLGRSARAGRPRPGLAPVSSPVASRAIPYLCALACGPLTLFPSRLRLESCYPSFAIFWLSSWRFACWRFDPRVIWSHVHRVSWLLSGFMIFF